MQILKQADRRFKGLELKVAGFAFVSLACIATLVVFVAYRSGYFTNETRLFLIAPSGEGISAGMPVKLSGFSIGSIKKIELVEKLAKPGRDGDNLPAPFSVRVQLSLNTKYLKWISRDCRAVLRREGMMGEQIIDLLPGPADAPRLKQNDYIRFEKEKAIVEYVAEITNAIELIKAKTTTFINYVNDPDGDVRLVVKDLKKFWADIHETRRRMAVLLINLDQKVDIVTKDANRITNSALNALSNLNEAVISTNATFPKTLKKVNLALDKLSDILEDTKKLVGTLTEKAPELMEKGGELSESAETLTDSIKKVWPISKYVKEKETISLPSESYDQK